jgi:hypothetical protein
LTGSEAYLGSFNTARTEIDTRIAKLRALTKQTDFTAAAAVNDLREMVNAKLLDLGNTMEIRRRAGLEPAIKQVLAIEGKDSLDRIQKLIASIETEEVRHQDEQAQEAKARAAFHQNLTIGLVGINVLFLVAVGLLGMKISRLQHLVTVCAWSQKVEYEGKWMRFEEFLQKRFGLRVSHGISEEEFEKFTGETAQSAAADEQVSAGLRA